MNALLISFPVLPVLLATPVRLIIIFLHCEAKRARESRLCPRALAALTSSSPKASVAMSRVPTPPLSTSQEKDISYNLASRASSGTQHGGIDEHTPPPGEFCSGGALKLCLAKFPVSLFPPSPVASKQHGILNLDLKCLECEVPHSIIVCVTLSVKIIIGYGTTP